jgi:hypothetical protein
LNTLEKLQHRIDLLVPKLESLKTANSHRRDNFIYIIRHSLTALNEGKEPIVWSGIDNVRFTLDIDGFNSYLDKAEQFLAAHVRRLK